MAPCAEAPHPVGFIRSVGFYLSLASTFPAHYCPLHGLVSFLRAITLSFDEYPSPVKSERLIKMVMISTVCSGQENNDKKK